MLEDLKKSPAMTKASYSRNRYTHNPDELGGKIPILVRVEGLRGFAEGFKGETSFDD
jgi:protochlorophyllide reductase